MSLEAPVILTPTDNAVTKINTPTISGTAEANSIVNVYDGETLIGTVTADGSGNWTLTPSTALVDGTHEITAKATDTLGNVSPVSNTVTITIYEASSISQHGIYSGSGTSIVAGNKVTIGIPVTMAMIVDAESSNPEINLSVDNNAQITVDKTLFKEYDANGTVIPLTLDDSGNITGVKMQKGVQYLIVYTITPVKIGSVKITAEADRTTPLPVNLEIGAQPDLF